MSTFVTGLETHQFEAYRTEVILKAQQKDSKLEKTAIIVPLVGEMTSLDAYGEIEWYSREEAGEENKVQKIERDRRWISSENFANTQRWERTEDHQNLHRFEPNGATMMASMAAWGRKKDEVFWTAFDANVLYGRAKKLQALPAAQKIDKTVKEIDVAATSGTSAEGATGDVVIEGSTASGYGSIDAAVSVPLNMGKIRAAQQLLLDQDVDDEMIHVATHSRQINDLLNSARFTELDNESMTELGRLGRRTGNTFYGMMWHRVNRAATQHTAGERYTYMYTDRAMVGGKVNGSEDVNLDLLVGNHHMRQLAIYADYGAVRRIDEEVVQINSKDVWN